MAELVQGASSVLEHRFLPPAIRGLLTLRPTTQRTRWIPMKAIGSIHLLTYFPVLNVLQVVRHLTLLCIYRSRPKDFHVVRQIFRSVLCPTVIKGSSCISSNISIRSYVEFSTPVYLTGSFHLIPFGYESGARAFARSITCSFHLETSRN